MTVYCLDTKENLDCHRQKQPTNLLLNVVEESVPTAHFSKPERADIVNLFKYLYLE